MQYVISENGPTHGFLILESFDNKKQAEAELSKQQALDKDNEYNPKITEVEMLSQKVTGVGADESEDTVTVKVQAKINGEKESADFHVQTTDGVYDTQKGCLILTAHGDASEIDTILLHCASVTELAESYIEQRD